MMSPLALPNQACYRTWEGKHRTGPADRSFIRPVRLCAGHEQKAAEKSAEIMRTDSILEVTPAPEDDVCIRLTRQLLIGLLG